MTSAKTRKCQESRLNSDNARDALLGLAPFSADWHAEANLLQVYIRSMLILIHLYPILNR